MMYHYTTLLHLPFILVDGYLKSHPDRKTNTDIFVWLTKNPNGDRTTSASHLDVRVRLSFEGIDTEPFTPAHFVENGFTQAHQEHLLAKAKRLNQSTAEWYVHRGDLPIKGAKMDVKVKHQPWRAIPPINIVATKEEKDVYRLCAFQLLTKTYVALALANNGKIATSYALNEVTSDYTPENIFHPDVTTRRLMANDLILMFNP